MYPKYHIAIGLSFENSVGQAVTDSVLKSIQSGSISFEYTPPSGTGSSLFNSSCATSYSSVHSYLVTVLIKLPLDAEEGSHQVAILQAFEEEKVFSLTNPGLILKYVVSNSRLTNTTILLASLAGRTIEHGDSGPAVIAYGLIGIFSPSLSGYLVKAMMTFKQLDRLRFISLDFKPLISIYFSKLKDAQLLPTYTWSNFDLRHQVGTRSKFNHYKSGIHFTKIMSPVCFVFLASAALRLLIWLASIRWPSKILGWVDKLHLKVYYSCLPFLAIDIAFFAGRTLFHGRLGNCDLISFAIAFTLSLVCLGVLFTDYWALCSCILDDGLWRKYIKYEISERQKISKNYFENKSKILGNRTRTSSTQLDFIGSQGSGNPEVTLIPERDVKLVKTGKPAISKFEEVVIDLFKGDLKRKIRVFTFNWSRICLFIPHLDQIFYPLILVGTQIAPLLGVACYLAWEISKLICVGIAVWRVGNFLSSYFLWAQYLLQSALMLGIVALLCIAGCKDTENALLSMAVIFGIVIGTSLFYVCIFLQFLLMIWVIYKEYKRSRTTSKVKDCAANTGIQQHPDKPWQEATIIRRADLSPESDFSPPSRKLRLKQLLNSAQQKSSTIQQNSIPTYAPSVVIKTDFKRFYVRPMPNQSTPVRPKLFGTSKKCFSTTTSKMPIY